MKPDKFIPVNRVAARVIGRGEHFEYQQLQTEVCSGVPLPVREPPLGFEHLVGVTFGRLKVVGRAREVMKRWVCRCLCGNYVYRKTAAIRQAAPDAACPQCYLMAVSKRKEYLRRTGQEKCTREFM